MCRAAAIVDSLIEAMDRRRFLNLLGLGGAAAAAAPVTTRVPATPAPLSAAEQWKQDYLSRRKFGSDALARRHFPNDPARAATVTKKWAQDAETGINQMLASTELDARRGLAYMGHPDYEPQKKALDAEHEKAFREFVAKAQKQQQQPEKSGQKPPAQRTQQQQQSPEREQPPQEQPQQQQPTQPKKDDRSRFDYAGGSEDTGYAEPYESRAAAIVDKLLEDEFDARAYFLTPPSATGRRIRSSYTVYTEDSIAAGDAEERGWDNEEGVGMDPDKYDLEDGVTAAQKATKFLNDKGAIYASSSHFHPGIWYSDHNNEWQGGEITEHDYHLAGFTPEEEQEIFNEVAMKI